MRRSAMFCLRWAACLTGGIAAAVALYVLAAFCLGLVPLNRAYRPARDGIDVYARSNGVHADLVVPIHAAGVDWGSRLPTGALQPVGGATDDIAFGWGDRGFYLSTPTWSDLRLGTAFMALTGLDTSVLHVELVDPPAPGPLTRRVRLTPDQYRRLAAFIEASFQTDDRGSKILIPGAHYGRHDAFFAARGHYSMFVTCNEWTRRALDRAAVRVPAWAPFDKALLFQIPTVADVRSHD